MRSTHSFAINIIKRTCKSNTKKALLYARISVDGERSEISLKESIIADDWDTAQEIVRGKTTKVKELNQHIEDVRYQIKSKYRMLQESGALITAETVKQAFLGMHNAQKGHQLLELTEYYKKIWGNKLSKGSYKNYKTTIDYIKLFLKFYPSKDIYLSQLNAELVTEFEHYIRNNPIKKHDPCLGNGVAKHIQRFKRIINWAAELQWIKSNPIEKYSCPVKKSKRKKLNIHQLVAFEQKNFQDPALAYVKDLFLNSCYTGFAFADVMELREGHFEWDTDGVIWCKIYRLKSDILSPVPLLKDATKIINKYKNHPESIKRGAIFPLISNQHVNRCLKLIQEICEFDIPLTFHVARHTFAKTVALKNGIPLETIQMLIGHTKITTTQIYADVDEEKIINDMSGLDDKLERKRELILKEQVFAAV